MTNLFSQKKLAIIGTLFGIYQRFREINFFTLTVKRDHEFYGKINIFSVKSTFSPKNLLE